MGSLIGDGSLIYPGLLETSSFEQDAISKSKRTDKEAIFIIIIFSWKLGLKAIEYLFNSFPKISN